MALRDDGDRRPMGRPKHCPGVGVCGFECPDTCWPQPNVTACSKDTRRQHLLVNFLQRNCQVVMGSRVHPRYRAGRPEDRQTDRVLWQGMFRPVRSAERAEWQGWLNCRRNRSPKGSIIAKPYSRLLRSGEEPGIKPVPQRWQPLNHQARIRQRTFDYMLSPDLLASLAINNRAAENSCARFLGQVNLASLKNARKHCLQIFDTGSQSRSIYGPYAGTWPITADDCSFVANDGLIQSA